MTPATKGKLAPVKDADHKQPLQHYVMQPGTAWKLTPEGRETVTISKEQSAKAEYTFCLIWHQHGTAAIFRVGQQEYAQPTEPLPEVKTRRAKNVDRPAPPPEVVCAAPTSKPRAPLRRSKKPLSLDW